LRQQEIAATSNAAVRKYHEDIPKNEVSSSGIAIAMKTAAKEATDKLYKKLSKIVVVANPALGAEWLEEIVLHICRLHSLDYFNM
jgi:hypothetical protein